MRRYRRLTYRLLVDAIDYTAGEYCVYCSGFDDAKAADETDDGELKHSRRCPTRQADRLAAEKI